MTLRARLGAAALGMTLADAPNSPLPFAWAADESNGVQTADVTPGEGSAAQWAKEPPDLPKVTEISILAGAPPRPGRFVVRVKRPADTMVAPHTIPGPSR